MTNTRVLLPQQGGCAACGALRYRLTAPQLMIYNCHCANCQKITGSAFTISATVFESAVEFTDGEPARIEWSADSGNRRVGLFCGSCGVRIAHGNVPTTGIPSLRAGALDDCRWTRPAAHIWMKSAAPWFTPPTDDLVFNAQPTDYAPIADLYRKRLSAIFDL